MRQLAEHNGIEAASIYSHFASKVELLQALAFDSAAAFQAAIAPVYAASLSPAVKLREMVVAHVETVSAQQATAGVFLNEWRHLPEPHLTEYLKLRDDYESLFREVLRQGIAAGVFRAIDPSFVSLILLSAANMTAGWLSTRGPLSPGALGGQLADLLLQGVAVDVVDVQALSSTHPSVN
jgi:TetR/AcrR family transcriptional regulator, cholesterol catabolism regulator